jgi:hypothetical protein
MLFVSYFTRVSVLQIAEHADMDNMHRVAFFGTHKKVHRKNFEKTDGWLRGMTDDNSVRQDFNFWPNYSEKNLPSPPSWFGNMQQNATPEAGSPPAQQRTFSSSFSLHHICTFLFLSCFFSMTVSA